MIASCLILCLVTGETTHEGLDQQIARATLEIESHPGRADLRLRRADLHRVHEDWAAAAADYDQAARLDPGLAAVHLGRARLWLAFGDAARAKSSADLFLAKEPDHADGLLERARALSRLGRSTESVEDFTRAIGRLAAPPPEIFLERAAAQRAQGRLEDAVRGLDEGIRALGAVVSLRLAALDLDVELRRYDSALARVLEIESRAERKDSWLVRRGEILLLAGRRDEAREAYRAALASIEGLPAGRRTAPFTRELEQKVRASLEVIDEKR